MAFESRQSDIEKQSTFGNGPNPHATERRAFARRASVCEVSVVRASSAKTHTNSEWLMMANDAKGALVDISMNGVAFQFEINSKQKSV
ncbi:MAG: hypothetical protein CMJ78_18990 [Planctomycetaceae bacterium]|nr:hypothetical protein [Planctomycetaceae bacterium]